MKKRITVIACVIFAAMVMTGCCLKHDWEEATCKDPKTCVNCGKTEGEALDHEWVAATCTEPKTCELCGKKKGEALGHKWEAATCTEPETCSVCGETDGEALGHSWSYATCQEERYCYVCGESDGQKGEHDWMEATCYSPEYCWYCDETRGERLPHSWTGSEGYLYCRNCYEDMPDNIVDDGYIFWVGISAEIPSGYVDYSANELKGSFADDNSMFYIVPHWNTGYTEDEVLEAYEGDLENAYEVEGSDIYYNADGLKFYRYECIYEGSLRGYCTIYYQDDVFVYMENFANSNISSAQFERIYEDIMDSFEIYY